MTEPPRPSADPFLERFFERIPPDVAASFTPEQIDAIRLAFGARRPIRHGIDVRLSLPLLLRRYYIVFLAGRERRRHTRSLEPARRFAGATAALILVFVLSATVALGLYGAKRYLGIDMVPGVDMLPDEAIESVLGVHRA